MVWNRAQRRISKLPTDVYRVYDPYWRLLYVGASVNVFSRLREHRMYADWWPHAHRGSVVRYENRHMARHVEAIAIRDEHPLFNVTRETTEERKRVKVTHPIQRFGLIWEDGRVWPDADR